MRHRHSLAALVALGLLLAFGAAPVRAEPYFMVRAGAKCNDCHTNMTGGGKRTPFAHIHARDILHDLDLLPVPPAVKAFNGQLHEYVSIGGDIRVRNTTVYQDRFDRRGNVPRNRFGRRSTTSSDFDVNESLLYLQVDLLPEFITVYNDFNVNGGVTNRETFGLVRGFLPYDTYVKAGRFFPAFGLRVQDDEAFIRARSGYTFTNPDEGVELGFAPGPFFLATSITNGPAGDKDVAATVNGYAVFQDIPVVKNILAGASYARQTDKRWVAGFYAGSTLWRFSYLGEFDVIDDRTVGSRARRDQYAAYAELNFLVFEWLNLRGTFDFVKVSREQDQSRFGMGVEPFVNRFIQPRVQYRINNGPPRPGAQPNELVENQAELLFELHFFF